jgi:hypothetical protein
MTTPGTSALCDPQAGCGAVRVVAQRVDDVEREQAGIRDDMAAIREGIAGIYKLLLTSLITLLCTAAVGLLTFVLTRLWETR